VETKVMTEQQFIFAATEEFPISIDSKALEHAKRWFLRKSEEGSFIRLGVKGGGCSGFEYLIIIDNRKLAIDREIVVDGVPFRMDFKSAEFLKGSNLVYSGNLLGGGLKFENPNAGRSCGCGTSFTPK